MAKPKLRSCPSCGESGPTWDRKEQSCDRCDALPPLPVSEMEGVSYQQIAPGIEQGFINGHPVSLYRQEMQ